MKQVCKYKAIGKSFCLLIMHLLFSALLINGQCPDKELLEKSIAYRDTSINSLNKHLVQLLSFLDNIESCPYKNDSTHARLAKKIGGVYYQRGDYLNAIKYYHQFITIINSNSQKILACLRDLPGCYYYLSKSYGALNLINEKMVALDSCYTIAIRIHYIDNSSAAALYEKGEHSFDIGDYNQCISYMKRCGSLAKQLPPEWGEQFRSSSLLWQVKALLELKNYEQAEKLLTTRIDECKKSGLINNLGTIFSQLAELQIRKDNYEKAILFYTKSFANDQHAGNNFNCRQTLKDIGYNIYFLHFNDGNKARACYFKALGIVNRSQSQKAEDLMESLDIYRLIARSFIQKKQFDLAGHYFQLAYHQIKPGLDEWNILNSPQAEILQYKKIHYLTSLIIDEADAYRSQYESNRQAAVLEKAIGIYKIADQFLDKIKQEQSDLLSKLFWRSDSRHLYENAINACYLQKNCEDAFYFFEKSRAVLLNDQLNEQQWTGEADIVKETQLEKKVLQLERELNTTDKSSTHYSDLEDELFNSQQQLKGLQELIKSNNPLYYQNFVDRTFITLKDVLQRILNDHQALVEMFSGDSAVYLITITTKQNYLQKVDKNIFDSLSTAYTFYISRPDFLNKNRDSFLHISHDLYQLLFQNIHVASGRIIISPDGKYFPIEALVTSMQPLTYFLDDHAVSYTYSARYLLNNFTANSGGGSHTFMGMAPVQYSNGLPALSASDQSLQRIQDYFHNAANFTGNRATKNNFLKEYYKYKIIQLYTHATDSGYGGEPVIYFSDSALSLSDLFYENRPATDLIVLSACETAGGKLYNGEGVFSFNRQFAALGIPSAVANLWSVDNESTYKLTELFYKYLAKGLTSDVALQKAKLEFIKTSSKEGSLPYYWAGPVLVGKSGSIKSDKPVPWRWVAVIAASLASLSFWGWRRRNKKKGSVIPNHQVILDSDL